MHGPSGCGKSTLLHSMIGLEPPTSGTVLVGRKSVYRLTEDERCDLRKSSFGVIQQQSHWIKSLTVLENVAIPLILWGYAKDVAHKKARLALQAVDMGKWDTYNPVELSSGQQQKAALARALSNDAPILIADEPTGNLDQKSGDALIDLMKLLVEERSKTVVMITHEKRFIKRAENVIQMLDGKIV